MFHSVSLLRQNFRTFSKCNCRLCSCLSVHVESEMRWNRFVIDPMSPTYRISPCSLLNSCFFRPRHRTPSRSWSRWSRRRRCWCASTRSGTSSPRTRSASTSSSARTSSRWEDEMDCKCYPVLWFLFICAIVGGGKLKFCSLKFGCLQMYKFHLHFNLVNPLKRYLRYHILL